MSPREAAELARLLRPAIGDERVLAAVASIPRERFVPDDQQDRAYANVGAPDRLRTRRSRNRSSSRGCSRRSELAPTDRVLDVGTGSGYHAALLSMLAGHVWTIERHRELSALAERAMLDLGIDNVTFVVGDGWEGLPGEAPFDAINVAAATGSALRALERQLADGGRLVAPVGTKEQHLIADPADGRTG